MEQSAKDADQLLVERVQQGDKRAFDLLVLKYQHKIIAVVHRYVRDSADVHDVVQEAFIKAYRALPTLHCLDLEVKLRFILGYIVLGSIQLKIILYLKVDVLPLLMSILRMQNTIVVMIICMMWIHQKTTCFVMSCRQRYKILCKIYLKTYVQRLPYVS